MGYETYRIADLIDEIAMGPFGSNIKVSCFVDSGVPVLNGSNLEGFSLSEKTFRYVTREKADSLNKANAHRGDIVITHRGTLGQIVFIPQDSKYDRYVISQSQFRVRCNDKVLPEYLVYYFHTPIGQHKLLSNASQVGVPALARPSSTFQQIEVVLPELSIQKRVVEIISTIQKKIVNNQELNDNLRQQAQAQFKKWFVDNPDAILWKEGTFSNLIEKTISGDWGKDSPSGNNTEMVYCIRGADIPEVRAGNKGKMPTRYILPKNYAAKQLVDGDIVVEISGGSPTQSTGRAAAVSDALLARYDKGMVCTNFCKALKPRAGYSMYVYYYWQYLYDRDIFFSYENGTTGIKNLDINGFIETEPIVIAPEDLVEKFDAVCQTVFSKIYANGMENEQLALVRDTILPKLMSGEIDVSAVQL